MNNTMKIARGIAALILLVIIGYFTYKYIIRENFSAPPTVHFTFFYMPGCPHCEAVDKSEDKEPGEKSEWDTFLELAKAEKTVNIVAKKVDGTNHSDPDVVKNKAYIKGFPTFVMSKSEDDSKPYEGKRTAVDFIAGIKAYANQ